MNKEEIEKTASKIMDNFLDAMKDIEVEEDFIANSNQCVREEEKGVETEIEFKKQFLENAPKTKGDSIIANKGSWT